MNFFDYIRQCQPSKRGELEISDVNNFYIRAGKMKWQKLEGYWLDAGTFETLYLANKHWAKKAKVK